MSPDSLTSSADLAAKKREARIGRNWARFLCSTLFIFISQVNLGIFFIVMSSLFSPCVLPSRLYQDCTEVQRGINFQFLLHDRPVDFFLLNSPKGVRRRCKGDDHTTYLHGCQTQGLYFIYRLPNLRKYIFLLHLQKTVIKYTTGSKN